MELIPEGAYKARATSMSWGESSNKHTPGVTVVFSLTDGLYKGKMFEWTGWMSPATSERTAESLAICGYDGEDDRTIALNEVELIIENESFTTSKGETRVRNRVQWVNDPGRSRSAFMNPVDEVKKTQFKDSMRGLILAQREARAKKGTPQNESFNYGANAATETPPNNKPDFKVGF
jgi:hypothetical protein